MKFRTWFFSFIILLLIWPFSGHADAAAARPIEIVLDGRILSSDSPPYIKPKNNVTMVPLRVISEGLGAQVDWLASAKSVTIAKDSNIIVLRVGSTSAQVNNAAVKLDVSAEIQSGRTMLPLRFVGEQLGLQVDWNSATRTIALSTQGTSIPPITGPTTPVIPPTEQPSTPPPAVQQPESGGAASELRGVWVSSVLNLDWPTKASYGNAEQQKQEYTKLLNEIQAMGLNAVFVQVRPTADALYPSQLVPWSVYLTGTAGKDPGYDPLAFLIEETHRRGMQFHAWFNPFRASMNADTSKLPSSHVVHQHPDWIVKFADKLYINPGIPEARQHIIDAIMEVVNGYDIDGVHLDDYFYPSGETASSKFNDDATMKRYNANQLNKGDWRRDNINQFVRDLGQSIRAVKPAVSYGISPFGVWRNKASDITGSDTKAGITAYDSTYADVRTWIRNEWIDYVTPQLYWSLTRPEVRYDILTDWWAQEVRGTQVKLYIGHSPYKIGTPEIGWHSADEIIHQLEYNERIPEVKGSIFFSAKDLRKNPLGLVPLLKSYFGS
ncbi:family 10 glycosylhydrolase [Paenibacillus woosongensis]|uniref:Family 10 glycosylhydrolase n=1 Tax=Paenibacillus woosongensis TaxID=307580 RepID=A0A7X3CMH9_9BACL|nr:family 10 glycosylhydrolase [Paenibacillus woosongensis]MUG44804.1 family 10 glycosylhydrolase [Paenibacillus woosongensis]